LLWTFKAAQGRRHSEASTSHEADIGIVYFTHWGEGQYFHGERKWVQLILSTI
jgi:hypothetical protein